MKAIGDPTRIMFTHGCIPGAGDVLRTTTGRCYVVLEASGDQFPYRLDCIVAPKGTLPTDGAKLIHFRWNKRSRRKH